MYRVDKRDYNIGETITVPENSYQDSTIFTDEKQTLERVLEEEKPTDKGGNRKSGLFIFAELSDAIRFSCVMTDSKIYKVKGLADTIFYHRGDMNLTEIMSKIIDQENALRELAKVYWQGGKTFKPCWEILVDKVQVTKVIIGDNDNRKRICADFKMAASQNIEKLNFYITQLSE